MATTLRELLPGVHCWSVFQPDRGYDFNGYHVDLGDTRVLIDPLPMDPVTAEGLEALGRPSLVLLTNKDHRRGAAAARERWGARVLAHALDAPLVGIPVDGTFRDGEVLAGALRVLHLPDQKSPGECALVWEERALVFLGDALVGDPPGRLRLLPPAKYADVPAARRTLVRRLSGLEVEGLLVGDGTPIPHGAAAVLRETLAGFPS